MSPPDVVDIDKPSTDPVSDSEIISNESDIEVAEKIDVNIENLKTFLDLTEIPVVTDQTERLSISTISSYSYSYCSAFDVILNLVQVKNKALQKHTNEFADKVLSITVQFLCEFLRNEGHADTIQQAVWSPRRKRIREETTKNIIENGERMKTRYGKRKRD